MAVHSHLFPDFLPVSLNAITVLAVGWRPRRTPAIDEDAELLARLRAGDEEAFLQLVARHQAMLLRLARSFVSSRRGRRGGRPGHLAGRAAGDRRLRRPVLVPDVAAADPRQPREEHGRSRGPLRSRWATPARPWTARASTLGRMDGPAPALGRGQPTSGCSRSRWRRRSRSALDELPGRQREVVLLRDVDGLSSRGGVRGPEHQRGQPARPAAPRVAAACARPSKRSSGRRMRCSGARASWSARRSSSWSPTTSRARCRARSGAASRRTWQAASTAPSTWSRCAPRSA